MLSEQSLLYLPGTFCVRRYGGRDQFGDDASDKCAWPVAYGSCERYNHYDRIYVLLGSGLCCNREQSGTGELYAGAVAVESIAQTETNTLDDTGEDTETDSGEADAEEEEETASDTEESSDEALESRLTVISAASLIDQQITDTFTTLENTTLFMNAVTANFEGVQNLSIEPKSLTVEYNTMQHTGLFSLLTVFGIPAVVIVGGFVVWFRRRKR